MEATFKWSYCTRTQLVINTSIVYMHRFYMFHSFKNYHRNAMASCFLFLSAKVEEQPRKLEHVLRAAHMCLKGDKEEPSLDPKSNEYMKLSQDLINNESVVLQTLGFELSVEHPHTYVVKCAQLVKASKDLAQTSYFLATNSLHLTTFCIQQKPTVVACICIYVSCKWANWEIMESQDKKNWWEYIDNSITPELLEDISSHFIKILDNSQTRLKKRIASGPLVYKGGVLQQKKLKEDGKVEDSARRHHNGNMDGQRSSTSEHSRVNRHPQDAHSSEDAKSTTSNSISRSKGNSSSAKSMTVDIKDNRKNNDPVPSSSHRHFEQSLHHLKRTADGAKVQRHSHSKLEHEDSRSSVAGHGHSHDTSENLADQAKRLAMDSKEKHMMLTQQQGKSTDALSRVGMSSSQIGGTSSHKSNSSTDSHLRHASPMKRPRHEGEIHSSLSESRNSLDSHAKQGQLKVDLDSKRSSLSHHVHKHKHGKSSTHHRHGAKPESDSLKSSQHASSHKPPSYKHPHAPRESSSSVSRPSSVSKHGSHALTAASRTSSQPSKSPLLAKAGPKKPKLEPTDPLVPPPPPPPSFPHAILNTSTSKIDGVPAKTLHGAQTHPGQFTSSSNLAASNALNDGPSQYRDFFIGGLPKIPLTDLLAPPPPPASSSSLNAPPPSPPPPPPPPRS